MIWLQGKKTYIVMIGAIVAGIVAFLTDQASLGEAMVAVIAALGLGTLRAGQTTEAKKVVETIKPGVPLVDAVPPPPEEP